MSPFVINRRIFWVAAGAIGAGAYLFVRHRLDALKEQEREREGSSARGGGASGTSSASSSGTSAAPGAESDEGAPGRPTTVHEGPAGEKELSEFLAGDSWYDEGGWRSIWEREGVADAGAWLRKEGKTTLKRARDSLADHPALLAGCRRRWIVVCRYAGIDVSDAASLWNETDG